MQMLTLERQLLEIVDNLVSIVEEGGNRHPNVGNIFSVLKNK